MLILQAVPKMPYLKEACMLHIQQEKCILKGKRLRNERSEGKYLWWREMAETQSTDKNEGSSSDVAQLQTEPETAPKGTREVLSSLVITQLRNWWMWRPRYGLCKVTPDWEGKYKILLEKEKWSKPCRICTENSRNKRGQSGFLWSIIMTLANVKRKLKSLSSNVKSS